MMTIAALAPDAVADVTLPALLGDGVVLQQKTGATIWGWAGAREAVRVTASWDGETVSTFADDRGGWNVRLATPGAGGPYTLTVRGVGDQGETTITLRNVMVGEVWVCSGQSNMEMPVGNFGGGYSGVDDYETEVAAADDPGLRLFTVPNRTSTMPRIDCRGVWTECRPDSANRFSATAYFFGRELRRQLGVPVGLISADWGGTVARAWTSADALRAYPEYAPRLAYLREMTDPDARESVVRERVSRWWETLDGDVDPAFTTDLDAARLRTAAGGEWLDVRLPAPMTAHGLDAFDGLVYFRRSFEVPGAAAGAPARLDLGPIDDYDDVWVNGRHVGATHSPGAWATPRSYAIAAGTLRAGRNAIVVRVLDTGGPGGLHGTPEQMRLAVSGGPPIPLAGDWQAARGRAVGELPEQPMGPEIGPNIETVLYNGMIAPLTPHAIRGVIWYQGESDRPRAEQYREQFPAMIRDWRRQWGQGDFPFYFVQIAPFGYGGDHGETAALREAQAAALELPATGMVVTLDIGDPANIHPKNKQEVGRRLALWALARTYGRSDLPHTGPRYRSATVEGSTIRVRFDDVSGGLDLRSIGADAFEIAGRDGVYVPARATVDGDALVLSAGGVPDPRTARYAWSAAPEAALFDGSGLPAAPFRTDAR